MRTDLERHDSFADEGQDDDDLRSDAEAPNKKRVHGSTPSLFPNIQRAPCTLNDMEIVVGYTKLIMGKVNYFASNLEPCYFLRAEL